MSFVICFFIQTLLLVFVPFWPDTFPYCDFLMQLVILVTFIVYFRQWEINLDLFIRNRYVLMLTSKSATNRLTLMARVRNLASKCQLNSADHPFAPQRES